MSSVNKVLMQENAKIYMVNKDL